MTLQKQFEELFYEAFCEDRDALGYKYTKSLGVRCIKWAANAVTLVKESYQYPQTALPICSTCGHGSAEHEWEDESHSSCLHGLCDCTGFVRTHIDPPRQYTLVPTSAILWLLGEVGDFVPPRTIEGTRAKYWWRSEFRRRMEEK